MAHRNDDDDGNARDVVEDGAAMRERGLAFEETGLGASLMTLEPG